MSRRLADRPDHIGRQRLRFTDAWIEDMQGQRLPSVASGQAVKLVVRYELAPGEPSAGPASRSRFTPSAALR